MTLRTPSDQEISVLQHQLIQYMKYFGIFYSNYLTIVNVNSPVVNNTRRLAKQSVSLFRIYKVLFIVIINIGVLGEIKAQPDRVWYRFMLIRIAEDDIGAQLNCTTTVTETFLPQHNSHRSICN